MITYIIAFLFFTWILPGCISATLLLKYLRDQRYKKETELKYNTLGDFVFATMAFFSGLMGLIAMLLILNENRIIKRYKP